MDPLDPSLSTTPAKMTTLHEKAMCVGWFIETKSDVQVRRNFRTQFHKHPPARNSIRQWHKKFLETGSLLDRKRSGRPSTCDEDVERIREAYQRNPGMSTRAAARELHLPRTTLHRVLHKRLRLLTFKPILYSYFRSSCTWRVRIALEYKNIAYDQKPVNLVKDGGEQYKEDFKKLNPMSQVPVLNIDGHYLVQSMSILEYLEEKFPNNPLLPVSLAERAKVRSIAETIASGIQPLQNLKALMALPEDKRQDWITNCITNGFTAVEQMLQSSSGKYCVGDSISIADCCLVPQVYNANRFKVDLTPFPIIRKINDALLKQPAFVKSHPSNQPDCPEDQKTPI